MKRSDLLLILTLAAVALLFSFGGVRAGYNLFNAAHPLLAAFGKFAILATLGEALAMRIRTGLYLPPAFGLIPRAIIWGMLGLTIHFAFVLFAAGVPRYLELLGVPEATTLLDGPLSWGKLLVALAVSTAMNTIYAPVMMTLHRITDAHIARNNGSIRALYTPIPMADIFENDIPWRRMWAFVFARTIPLFWIPAHTVSFLMPPDARTLFAALLGMALGVILALGSPK